MIKRITSSKGIVTAVWVLGLVVIWEICAFIVGATQRTPVNVLPHLYQIIGSFFDTKSITGSGDTIATLVFSSAAETLSRALIGFIIGMVLGYILAGFLIGPYMPLFFSLADIEAVSTWSEIGIIILMFGLGLEFNLHKLVSVGGTAIITALTEVGGMLLFGYLVGQALGWGTMDSVFLGGMLSMSSTTIIIKAFDDLGVQKERFAQLVFGTLVIEDIAGIFMMIILSTISVGQGISGMALALKLGMLVLYLALWLILGIYLLPTLLNKASPLMSDETLLVVSLGLCFGMVLLADALGFSSALGAFLAGSLLAGTVPSAWSI